ncbi:MAG: TAT-variant-translocated molybdopterin oxidoreductase, partial [Pirellulaceae bacterium]
MIKPNPNSNGKNYWRSLDELQGNPQLDEVIEHDFGAAAPPATDGVSRRRWLQLMGASMAFGSMMSAGCRYPAQNIAPFAFRPQGRTPGVPQSFSTTLEMGGYARPVVATSYDGRPIKLDGNPDHPDSRGVSDIFTQSTILELYDPDRSRTPARKGDDGLLEVTWDDAINQFKSLVAGSGVAVLAEPCSSPTVHRLRQVMLDANSDARWFEFTSVSDDNSDEGSRTVFGDVYRPQLRLADAKVIVAIDADPLGDVARGSRNTLDYTSSRDADRVMHDPSFEMSRLYCVESDFTKTGSNADHRLPLRFSQIAPFLAALEAVIDSGSSEVDTSASEAEQVLAAMAEDLLKHKGAGAVVVGACQPAEVHARAFRINSKLENLGKTIVLNQPIAAPEKPGVEQLRELTEAINQGSIQTLLILGGNPVFFAPSDLNFADALARVANTCHLSLYRDETTLACKWHMNAAHPLETWGDGTAPDGSVCLAQPMINPLFGGKSVIELLAILTGQEQHSHDEHSHDEHSHDEPTGEQHAEGEHAGEHDDHAHDKALGLMMVQETHAGSLGGHHPGDAWQLAVRKGFIADSAVAPSAPGLQLVNLPADDGSWKNVWNGSEPELIFRPSPSIYDGRFANNGWLQELPEF